MKEHEARELVNTLRDIANECHGTGQLRERIAKEIRPLITPAGMKEALVTVREYNGQVRLLTENQDALHYIGRIEYWCAKALGITEEDDMSKMRAKMKITSVNSFGGGQP